MGIDVEIYFEADGEPSDLCPLCGEVSLADDYEREHGPTHKIVSMSRYYGVGYERGSWPHICGTLMSLFASPNVKRVWYFGDSTDIDSAAPITRDEVLALSRHYMLNGERPYRTGAKPISTEDPVTIDGEAREVHFLSATPL